MVRLQFVFSIIFLLFSQLLNAQSNFTFSGSVKDSATGEDLVGATIFIAEIAKGAVTNEYGFFSLTVPAGIYTVKIDYIGYSSTTVYLDLNQNISRRIQLSPVTLQTKEVIVSATKEDRNVRSTEMGRAELSAEKIRTLPVILGEPDVLKAITLLPGIKSGGEGNTGFYVRGGGPDQNLILMDEAVVYNPAHLLGFLSVFNSDAIKNAQIIKGGMPANFGGRLSSILTVSMREGNNQKYVVNGGVGLIASRVTIEGPIQKGISSFMISGRRTYIDALAQPFLTREQKGNSYYFYDLNFKCNYTFSPKNRLFLSGYLGRDIFSFKSTRNNSNNNIIFKAFWGNSIATLRWNYVFSPKMFMNTSLVYNRYDLKTSFEFLSNEFSASSGLRDWNLKGDIDYYPNHIHKIKFGYNYTWHTFVPGIASGTLGSLNLNQEINKQYAHEGALYALDDFAINDKFLINVGLRYVMFNQVGPYTSQTLNEDGEFTGETKEWKPQESIAFYQGLEPRAIVTYILPSNFSIKGSYTKTHQFLHLATTSGATFPTDLWIPSSQKVRPQSAEQVSLGVYKNFKENMYESSIEGYYKEMKNQIEFKPGARLFLNQNLENEVLPGQGKAYGLEFFIKKREGRFNGWIGYTLSKTTRQFEELNYGKPFLYRYDRRHDISVVASYTLNERWTLNAVFVYGTGIAITLPTSRFTYNVGFDAEKVEPKFTLLNRYEGINNYRMPAYHRADISVNYAKKTTKRFQSSWIFSIYNIYNRKNPYFIYFEPNLETRTIKAYMVYLFPFMPSVLWNFTF